MADQKAMLEHARTFLRTNPECDEASLNYLLTARFLLQDESVPFGGADLGIFFVFLWPIFIFKWLSFRRRLREFNAEMDAVISVLRQEGFFTKDGLRNNFPI